MINYSFIIQLEYLREELGNHSVDELLFIFIALDASIEEEPLTASNIVKETGMCRETAKNMACRYSGASYRGREPFDKKLFTRVKTNQGPGQQKILKHTAAGLKLLTVIEGKSR